MTVSRRSLATAPVWRAHEAAFSASWRTVVSSDWVDSNARPAGAFADFAAPTAPAMDTATTIAIGSRMRSVSFDKTARHGHAAREPRNRETRQAYKIRRD